MAQLIHGTTINGHIAIHAGNMADHSIATTSYVTTQISNLINGAPGALNTLDELAAALGDDASFATSVTNSLAGKVSKSGDVITTSNNYGLVIDHTPVLGDFVDALLVRSTTSGQRAQIGFATVDSDGNHHRASLRAYKGAGTLEGAFGIALRQATSGSHIQRFTLDYLGNLTIDGTISASGYNKSNWDTAYGWGNHAGLYAAASHNHDDRYYTESESDSRFVNTSGDTMSGRLTLSSISGVSQTVPNDFGAYLHLGDWGVGRTATGAVLVNTAYRADYATDLFDMNISRFTNNSAYITTNGRAYPRNASGGDINFYWSGQSGQPTWLWGGTDGTNMYVYNPSNFSVNYAASAGSVAWTNVSSRPTALSQFTNDLGNYGGFLTSLPSHNHDGVYVPINPDGDGPAWSYSDNNPTINGKYVGGGQRFGADGDNLTGGFLQSRHLNAYDGHVNSSDGYYVGVIEYGSIPGAYDTTQVIDSAGRWTGVAIADNKIASSGNWNTAYNKRPTAIAFSGSSTKTLTLTQGDGSTLTASFSDIDTDTNTDGQTLSLSGNTLSISGGNSVTLSTGGISQATADGLYVAKAGGSTVAGITYFSNGESINLYGIRGRYSGDGIHLYGKVDIGNPSGWGAGIGNTPNYGLSTFGGAYFAYNQGTVSIGALGTAKLHVIGNTSGQELFAVDGVNGRLFSVVDDLSDSLYSVNTIAGLPVLEVFANNVVTIGKFGTNAIYVGQDGRVGFGTTDFSYTAADQTSPTNNRLFVNGSIQLLGANDAIVFGRGTATVLRDEKLAFGWGSGWFMEDADYLRVLGNKTVYSGGSARFDSYVYLGGATYYLYQANSGIWTNGNLGASGDLYLGTRSTWLSSYLNQAVLTSSSPTFSDVYANEWFRNNNNNEGLYNQANGNHFYSRGGSIWGITGNGGSVVHLQFRINHESTLRGSVYGDGSGFGLLDSGDNWRVRVDTGGAQVYGSLTIGNTTSSDIYMTDTDETTRRIHTNSGRIGFLNSSSGWGAYCDNTGNWRTDYDMHATYFYGGGSIRVGDMWGGAGLYRPSGSMVFGIENSDWIFSKGAVTQAYFAGGDGNLWMRWAGDWLSNLLGAKSNVGHTHDDRYYTESESDSRYILKGTQISSSASWPTATRFGSVGNLSQDAGNHALSVRSEDGNDAFMSFHIGNDYAVHFGLERSSNRMHVGGWSETGSRYQLWDSRDFSSTNISNWNTAYGWGNHAGVGYLTSLPSHTHDDRYYTETEINNFSYWRNDEARTIKTLFFTGVGGDSGNSSNHSYAIYQGGGGWSHPYPDLHIGYHTGIKLGANTGYGGTRFYSDSDMATELFSVGNGDTHVRVANNLYASALFDAGSRVAISRGEGRNYIDYSRYVYNNGAYSGSGWIEPSDLGVRYAYYGRLAYNNGAYSGSGWVEPSDLGVRYANTSGYATSSYIVNSTNDYRHSNRNPNDWHGLANSWHFNDRDTVGMSGSDYWVSILTVCPWSSYDPSHRQNQLGFGGAAGLYHRYATSGTSWSGWSRMYSDAYRPYADSAGSVAWDNVTSKPGIYLHNTWHGNVYLGTGGDVYCTILYDSNNSGYYLDPNGTSRLNRTNYDYVYSYNWVYAEGDIIAFYSDERLKTRVGTIENALDKIKQLTGFYYVNNDLAKSFGYKDEKLQVGLSAQEVQSVLPEVVTLAPFDTEFDENNQAIGSKSGESYLTVSYDKLVPLLIESIKEQQLQIEELRSEVKKLKGE
jgi:hypothetical protein